MNRRNHHKHKIERMNRVREIRATLRMTQIELGALIGVDGGRVSKWESEKYSAMPTDAQIQTLERAYDRVEYRIPKAEPVRAGIICRSCGSFLDEVALAALISKHGISEALKRIKMEGD